MTKVKAIKKVLEDHQGLATWEIIIDEVEKYYPNAKNSATRQDGLRGVYNREEKLGKTFKRVGIGTLARIDYDELAFTKSPPFLKNNEKS